MATQFQYLFSGITVGQTGSLVLGGPSEYVIHGVANFTGGQASVNNLIRFDTALDGSVGFVPVNMSANTLTTGGQAVYLAGSKGITSIESSLPKLIRWRAEIISGDLSAFIAYKRVDKYRSE